MPCISKYQVAQIRQYISIPFKTTHLHVIYAKAVCKGWCNRPKNYRAHHCKFSSSLNERRNELQRPEFMEQDSPAVFLRKRISSGIGTVKKQCGNSWREHIYKRPCHKKETVFWQTEILAPYKILFCNSTIHQRQLWQDEIWGGEGLSLKEVAVVHP